MVTFNQLKNMLKRDFTEILVFDDDMDETIIETTERKFDNARSLLDIVHIYESFGYETHDAHDSILNSVMNNMSFDI
jgi:hypothetical protein